MSETELILKKEDAVATIVFNRPGVHNALNTQMVTRLSEAIDDIEADKTIRVVVLTGSGEKSFVSGSDINELRTRTPVTGVETSLKRQELLNRIENLGNPTIAAINGYAFGVGCEIAMACTLRIASEKARLGQLEINLGIIPGAGGTQRLPRLIGKSRAAELILTGKIISAPEACAIGLVNQVVPAEKLMNECRLLADKIIEKSSIAVKFALRALNEGMEVDLMAGLEIERLCLGACYASTDSQEGLNAFLEKRKPMYKGC